MNQVKVYFDGLCHLCSREIAHYRKLKGAENIHFQDITDSSFDALREGLDPVSVHKSLHARDRSGKIYLGVDAFICIWQELPAFQLVARLVRVAPVYYFLKVLYAGFAKLRPLLPRKSCSDSPYCEIKKRDD